MNRTLRQTLNLGLTLGASLLAASPAFAQWGRVATTAQPQGQLLFEWQGNVDRETQFQIGRRGIDVRGTQSQESRGRFVNRNSIPNGSGTLYVQRVSGRGSVDVLQQPNNSGDGVVRISDGSGGQGYYDIRVYWQPNGTYGNNGNNGNVYGNGGRDNDRDRDRNNDRDRGDDRNRGNDRDRDVARDRKGNVIRDRQGNVVYERRGNDVVVRDRNGNVMFDRNGNAVYVRNDNNGRRGR